MMNDESVDNNLANYEASFIYLNSDLTIKIH